MRDLPQNKGKWIHSAIFLEVEAAHEWGLTPDEFRGKSELEQAEMMAYLSTMSKMKGYEAYQQEREADRIKARPSKGRR